MALLERISPGGVAGASNLDGAHTRAQVLITVTTRQPNAEQLADALLASLKLSQAARSAYRQANHGVDIRDQLITEFRGQGINSAALEYAGSGQYRASIGIPKQTYQRLIELSQTDRQAPAIGPTAKQLEFRAQGALTRHQLELQLRQTEANQQVVNGGLGSCSVPVAGPAEDLRGSPKLNLLAATDGTKQSPSQSTPDESGLLLDLTQMGLDLAGIVDPTPISDGASGIISLFRGDLVGAGISVAGFIPVLGDLAKLGKLGRYAKTLGQVIELARTSERFADLVRPAMRNLKDLLDRVPLDQLPAPVRTTIEALKTKVDEFFARPSHTKPSGQGELTGRPERIDPNEKDPANIRALTRQNESAVTLKNAGYKVEQGPTITADDLKQNPGLKPTKNPDYRIEGEIFDAYSPSTSNARNIASVIENTKVATGQANRIVLNLDDSKVTMEAMRKQLEDYPIPGLKEVIIVKDGQVIPFFPFK